MEENARKPRRFQFSLRSVLILTAFVAVPLAWWSYKVQQKRHAVAVLMKSHAAITANYRDASKVDVMLDQKPTPADIEALKILGPAVVYLIWLDANDVAMLKRVLNCEVVTPPPSGPSP